MITIFTFTFKIKCSFQLFLRPRRIPYIVLLFGPFFTAVLLILQCRNLTAQGYNGLSLSTKSACGLLPYVSRLLYLVGYACPCCWQLNTISSKRRVCFSATSAAQRRIGAFLFIAFSASTLPGRKNTWILLLSVKSTSLKF